MDENGPARRMTCLLCFSDVMLLKYDRKGRAYLNCMACGTMIFPKMGDVSIVGYKVAARTVQPFLAIVRKEFEGYRLAIADGRFGLAQQQGLTSVPAAVETPAEVRRATG